MKRSHLSPARREQFARLQFDMDINGPYERYRQRERERSRHRRERLRLLALPILITIILAAAAAFAALLVAPRPQADGLVITPEAPMPTVAPSPEALDIRSEADATAREFNIDTRLFAAVIHTESRWKSDAVGAAGEIGLMQLMPSTARSLGVDPHDIKDNLRGGAMYLRRHYDRTGDWTRALTRYNGRGPKARAYAQRVLRAWESGE